MRQFSKGKVVLNQLNGRRRDAPAPSRAAPAAPSGSARPLPGSAYGTDNPTAGSPGSAVRRATGCKPVRAPKPDQERAPRRAAPGYTGGGDLSKAPPSARVRPLVRDT